MRKSLEILPVMFDEIRSARDTYKAQYEAALNAHKQKTDELPSRFIGKELADRRDKAKVEFEERIKALRNDFFDRIVKATAEVEHEIEREVGRPFTPTPITSLIQQGIPVTKSEFDVLYRQFAGDSYWNSKLFSDLAVKNGLDAKLPVDADSVLSILRTIRSEADTLVNTWNGETESNISARMQLSDRKLQRWENTCLTGYTAHLTPQQKASRALGNVLQELQSPMQRVLAINNTLRNLEEDDETKQLFLYGLSQDDRLFNVSTVPFLDGDYQQIIREYHDGKRPAPQSKVEEPEEPDALSPEMQATAEALNKIAAAKRAETAQ